VDNLPYFVQRFWAGRIDAQFVTLSCLEAKPILTATMGQWVTMTNKLHPI
jgi:hypothetical protein